MTRGRRRRGRLVGLVFDLFAGFLQPFGCFFGRPIKSITCVFTGFFQLLGSRIGCIAGFFL